LEIESGEVLAEYRPALTDAGAAGLEVEIFIYDTLAGGAGFSPQLVERGDELFRTALSILVDCPERCDTSCYRCLRSFRNKIDHRLLDRVLGQQLLQHAMEGGYPTYPRGRVEATSDLLFEDLRRQLSDDFLFERNAVRRPPGGSDVVVPIILTRRSTGAETWIAISSPIACDVPVDAQLRELFAVVDHGNVLCMDDLLVRRHLAAAVDRARLSMN
jgi:hypothetical protein